MLILVVGWWLPAAAAQRQVSADQMAALSHRKLVLPQSGGDHRQQLARLRQLQALWQRNQNSASNNGEGLSQIQKAMAEQMMRQSLRNGDVPKLDELPPDLVSKLLSDPAARSDIQELLQKFQQDGLMPQGNAAGGSPSGPTLPGSRNAQNGTRSLPNSENNRARVLREPNRDASESPADQSDPAADNDDQPADANRPGETNGEPPARSRQSDARRLSQGRGANNPRTNSSNSGSNAPSNAGDSNRSGMPPGIPNADFLKKQPGESAQQYNRRISDYLDEQIGRQSAARNNSRRSADGRQPNANGPNANGPNVNGFDAGGNARNRNLFDPNSLNAEDFNSNPAGDGTQERPSVAPQDRRQQSPTDRGGNGTAAEPPVSMSDLWQDLGGLSEELRQSAAAGSRSGSASGPRGNAQSGTRQSGGNRGSTGGNSSGASAANAELQDAARKMMQQRGFNAAMREVLSSARQRAADRAARGDGSSTAAGGMTESARQAMSKALSGLSEEVVELAKNARGRRSSANSSTNSSSNSSANRAGRNSGSSRSRSSSTDSGWLSRMQDSFSDLSRSSPASSTGGGGGGSFTGPGLSGGSVLSVFVFLGIVAAVVWWLMKAGHLQPAHQHTPLTRARIRGIRSRQDVIDAFHLIALDPGHDTQAWWHHEQVRADLVAKSPSRKEPLEELTHVYEQARYLPDEVALNEQQLTAARQAFERCRP